MGGISYDGGLNDASGISHRLGLTSSGGLVYIGGSNPIADILGSALRFWGNGQNVTLNATRVSVMANLATGNNSAVQAVAASQPLYIASAINGYPAIHIDDVARNLVATQAGITGNIYSAMVINIPAYGPAAYGRILSYRLGGTIDYNNPACIAVLLRENLTSQLYSWYSSAVSGLGTSFPQVTAGATYFTLETLLDDTNDLITHWVNGVSVYTNAWTGTLGSNNINIGDGQSGNSHEFKIAELIVSLASPTAGQQTAIRNFLRTKYNHY